MSRFAAFLCLKLQLVSLEQNKSFGDITLGYGNA